MAMFDYDVNTRSHHTAKEGEQSYLAWMKQMGLSRENFPFKVKTNRRDKRGFEVYLNMVSWGFYQGSDWRYYVFITYRSSDQKMTCAYHWDVDENAMPVGTPRMHQWSN